MNWLAGPAWPGVHIRFTTRQGGTSRPPYASLNVGAHVGDDPFAVAANRRLLRDALPAEPLWLSQVHGTRVWDADHDAADAHVPPQADAAVTATAGRVIAVMVADCLPIAISDHRGTIVAVVHAGWRGLADGVIEATVQRLQRARAHERHWRAWIGPAIGASAFEVGADVRDACLRSDPGCSGAFVALEHAPAKWLADLPGMAARRLSAAGVHSIEQSGRCTFSESDYFFSYRRDGVCGRMVLLAWLKEDPN